MGRYDVILIGHKDLGEPIRERLLLEGLSSTLVEIGPKNEPLSLDLELTGQMGDFELLVKGKEGSVRYKASFILICLIPIFEASVTQGNFLSLDQFIRNGQTLRDLKEIAFVDPTDGRIIASRWEILFDFLLGIELSPEQKVHVISSQIKVARNGLERKYKRLRERGVVFYKPLNLTLRGSEGNTLAFVDEISNEEVTLMPELIVLMDGPRIPPEFQALFKSLKIEIDENGFPQADNVLRLPNYTNRNGVYIISPQPDYLADQQINDLISSTIFEIKEKMPKVKDLKVGKPVEYNQKNCAFCLTCLRVCPHSAIIFGTIPNFMPLACKECGICMANCPGEALTLIRTPHDSIVDEVLKGIQKGYQKLILACSRSGKLFLESLSDILPKLRNYWIVELPCTGILNEKLILNICLLQGLEELKIVGCKKDNCSTNTGTLRAQKAVEATKAIMEQVNGDPRKVEFFRVSSQDALSLFAAFGS